MNCANLEAYRLAYNFGRISPNKRRMKVTTITCTRNCRVLDVPKSISLFMTKEDKITIPTLIKLLVIRMVPSNLSGFLISSSTALEFRLPLSSRFRLSVGESEK